MGDATKFLLGDEEPAAAVERFATSALGALKQPLTWENLDDAAEDLHKAKQIVEHMIDTLPDPDDA